MRGKRTRLTRRIDSSAPERFVRVNVADSHNPLLIHDHFLDCLPRTPKDSRKSLFAELRVKWLHTEAPLVLGPALRGEQAYGAQPAYIAVVQSSAVVEQKVERGVGSVTLVQVAIVQQQATGKSRLYGQPVAGREVEDDQLCTTPGALNARALETPGELKRCNFAQHVGPPDAYAEDRSANYLAREITRDSLGFG